MLDCSERRRGWSGMGGPGGTNCNLAKLNTHHRVHHTTHADRPLLLGRTAKPLQLRFGRCLAILPAHISRGISLQCCTFFALTPAPPLSVPRAKPVAANDARSVGCDDRRTLCRRQRAF